MINVVKIVTSPFIMFTLIVSLFLTGCGGSSSSNVGANSFSRENAVNTSAVTLPIDIAFIPGMGSAFVVISQNGRVYFFNGSLDPVNTVNLASVLPVVSGGEQGLLNVEFHPDFAINNYVFFYHTSVSSTVNSVSRMTVTFDGSGNLVLSDLVKIIDFRKPNAASNHNGGGLVFAPDATLLASVGVMAEEGVTA